MAGIGCMTCFCQLYKPAVADYALPFFPQLGVKYIPFQEQLKRYYFQNLNVSIISFTFINLYLFIQMQICIFIV